MSKKLTEFENALSDLITETFSTKEELQEAIEYSHTSCFTDMLEDKLQYIEGGISKAKAQILILPCDKCKRSTKHEIFDYVPYGTRIQQGSRCLEHD